jgi:hypothetical protein
VKADVHRLRQRAEEEGDLRMALLGCDKALKALELQAKVEQLIQTTPTFNLELNPEWLELKAVIIGALSEHPPALRAVRAAIKEARTNGSQ